MGKPNIEGQAGRAWLFEVTPEERALKPFALNAYLVHQPGVHAFWSWWFITGCSLSDDGADPAVFGKFKAQLHRPGVTHEWSCWALNPETGFYARDKATPPEGWDSIDEDNPARVGRHWLLPAEFIYQDELRDNDQANEVMRLFVRAVCDGITVADADFRQRNIGLLKGTCAHYRAGKHDVH
jgi:hypothetical protein